jgi:hypothetical protein
VDAHPGVTAHVRALAAVVVALALEPDFVEVRLRGGFVEHTVPDADRQDPRRDHLRVFGDPGDRKDRIPLAYGHVTTLREMW